MSYWDGLTGYTNGLDNGLGYWASPPDTHAHKN